MTHSATKNLKNLPCSQFFSNDENFEFPENQIDDNIQILTINCSQSAFKKQPEINEISPLQINLNKYKAAVPVDKNLNLNNSLA